MSICHKISQFPKDPNHRCRLFYPLKHDFIVFQFQNQKIKHHIRMDPPGRPDTDFVFQYFKSRYLGFLKDEFYQFHSGWSGDTERQLFKSSHWTFLCSPLNALLISEIEPFYKFIFSFRFNPALLRGFIRHIQPWNICNNNKDKLIVSSEPYLQLPILLLLLQIIAIFFWLWKQKETEYLFSQLFCSLMIFAL